MAKASWNGATLAESENTVIVEGNHYFPEDSVRQDLLQPSDHQTRCGWKGTASYKHISVDGELNENAVWYYPDPKPEAEQIRGRYAFWKGVAVEGGPGPDQAPDDASCDLEAK